VVRLTFWKLQGGSVIVSLVNSNSLRQCGV
jgi:hypothetical protein